MKRGNIVYNNDKAENILNEKGLRYEAKYEYIGQNRMVYSLSTSHVEKTHEVSSYSYDALGRRTLTTSVTGEAIRTLYDGRSFEVIREGEAFRDGSFTTRSSYSGVLENDTGMMQSNQATGERYRWIGDSSNGRITNEDSYTVTGSRYESRGVTLYGKGEAVAMSSSTGSRTMYLGKDIMGSVRTVTVDTGTLEERYEYDAFGQPYKGDLSGGMNLGYTGKPYNKATGLYNYGYRDYKPQAARFTTMDPIRDGNNWFAYVNNDPVNWWDPWGLEGWFNTGGFGDNYSGVTGANEPTHLGKDHVYQDSNGNNITVGQPVYSHTDGTVETGYRDDIGNYVRVTSPEGFRDDYFHLATTTVESGANIEAGQQVGTAGSTGTDTAHLHEARSYPEGQAPEGLETIDRYGRSYVEPPDTPAAPPVTPAPPTPQTSIDDLSASVANSSQRNKNY